LHTEVKPTLSASDCVDNDISSSACGRSRSAEQITYGVGVFFFSLDSMTWFIESTST